MRASEYENELKQRDDTIQQQADTIGRLETESEELKKLLAGKAEAKSAKKPTFTQNYSLDKNKRAKQRRKQSTGRRGNDAKRDLIEHQYDIFWHNADRQQCIPRNSGDTISNLAVWGNLGFRPGLRGRRTRPASFSKRWTNVAPPSIFGVVGREPSPHFVFNFRRAQNRPPGVNPGELHPASDSILPQNAFGETSLRLELAKLS